VQVALDRSFGGLCMMHVFSNAIIWHSDSFKPYYFEDCKPSQTKQASEIPLQACLKCGPILLLLQ